jgi:hypothetical protein
MVDTKELRGLLSMATASEWKFAPAKRGEITTIYSADANIGFTTNDGIGVDQQNDDAALICAAVNALPELLDELEKIRGCLRLIVEGAMPATVSGQTCFVPRYQINNARTLLPAGDGKGETNGRG